MGLFVVGQGVLGLEFPSAFKLRALEGVEIRVLGDVVSVKLHSGGEGFETVASKRTFGRSGLTFASILDLGEYYTRFLE